MGIAGSKCGRLAAGDANRMHSWRSPCASVFPAAAQQAGAEQKAGESTGRFGNGRPGEGGAIDGEAVSRIQEILVVVGSARIHHLQQTVAESGSGEGAATSK